MVVEVHQNRKTQFTRMCISEAILALLETTDFNKLKISAIVDKAGVARMTFYNYYQTPYDALTDYLQIIVGKYMEENKREQNRDTYMTYDHILYSLNFFDRYANFFLILSKHNLYSIMIAGVNRFMEENIHTRRKMSVYQLYMYAGGLLNAFLKWEESGKKDSAESVAMAIYNMNRNVTAEE